MEIVPVSVGQVARAWDEQHLDVAAAAGQLGDAPVSGFTDAVTGSAARFSSTWQRHTAALADQAEVRADGLRRVIADFVETDQAVSHHLVGLGGYLVEPR